MLKFKQNYATVILLAVSVVLLVGAYTLQRQIDARMQNSSLDERPFPSLPSGKYLKSAALGFDVVLADFIWANVVVTAGERFSKSQDYTGLYDLLDIITVLDPLFHEAYHFGGILLSMQAGLVDESITLLERGIEKYPDDWRLHFIQGFNFIHYKKNDAKAVAHFERAASLPGAFAYLPRLVGNLYANVGKIDLALVFLEDAYNQFRDEKMREEIEEKIKGLLSEKHIIVLEDAAKEFKKTYGKYPNRIEHLAQANLISSIPDEPHGGRYLIDPQQGAVIGIHLLFHTDLKFQDDLGNGNDISEDLRQEFDDNEIALSENVSVSVRKEDTAWLITDEIVASTIQYSRGFGTFC